MKAHSLGVPDDEYGFTDLLVEGGLIEDEEKRLLDDLRGLRNRLVHRYGSVDDEIVHARIREDLDDVQELVSRLRDIVAQT